MAITLQNDTLSTLRRLSDEELVARVKGLAARERAATAQLVAHLAELDTRDIHLRAGYSSLFIYCRDALHLSEHEAYNRIEAARAVRRFPVILQLLEGGSVNLTTVRLLAPHLTPENHRQVLESARGKRKARVEEIVARLSPRPDVPSSLRKLPTRRPGPPATPSSLDTPRSAAPEGPVLSVPATPPPDAPPGTTPALTASLDAADGETRDGSLALSPCQTSSLLTSASSSPLPPPRAALLTPLAPDRYKLQFTIGGDTLEKLRLAKDMLRHAVPSGDEAAILDRALTVLLADLARKKFAAAGKRRASRASRKTAPGSRHIPAEVRRKVWLRDLGRCAFVGTGGRRCAERALLEFHHVRPFAVGGEASVRNVELRCRRHNGYEARVYFGHSHSGARAGVASEAGAGVAREEALAYGAPSRTDAQAVRSPAVPRASAVR